MRQGVAAFKDNVVDNKSGSIGTRDGTRLDGTDGDDLIIGKFKGNGGNRVDEIIEGGRGEDTIRGWGGNDLIDVGNDNAKDTVVMSPTHPSDTGTVTRVTNFNPDDDKITLTYIDGKRGVKDITANDINITDTGDGALIEVIGGQDILLEGVDADDLDIGDNFGGFA